MSASSYLVKEHEAEKLSGQYFSMAGTSQATAVASGVAALTIAHNPDLTPDQVKYRLMRSAILWIDPQTTDALYSMWQQGAGRINAVDAVFGEISGAANANMNIYADLAGETHYEGYTYYDEESNQFMLNGVAI